MSQDHEKLNPFSLSLPPSPHSQLRKITLGFSDPETATYT